MTVVGRINRVHVIGIHPRLSLGIMFSIRVRQMFKHVLHHYYGAIHQHANGDRNPPQRHQIGRQSEPSHHH